MESVCLTVLSYFHETANLAFIAVRSRVLNYELSFVCSYLFPLLLRLFADLNAFESREFWFIDRGAFLDYLLI